MKRLLVVVVVLLFSFALAQQPQWEYGVFYFFGGNSPSWAWTTEGETIDDDDAETFWEELTGELWLGVSGINIDIVSWLGSQGWELVDVEEGELSIGYYFKRQVIE